MKKLLTLTLTTVMALLLSMNANAGLLSLNLSTDQLNIGESVTVTINVEGFDATDQFWFDLNLDNSLLAYEETSLNSDLLLVDAGIGIVDGLAVASENFGLSFDFFDSVMSADGNFMLASFDFIATTEGITNFSVTDFWNTEAFTDYDIVFTGADSVNVSAVAVPEPSTVFMMMLAGVALVSTRRQAK